LLPKWASPEKILNSHTNLPKKCPVLSYSHGKKDCIPLALRWIHVWLEQALSILFSDMPISCTYSAVHF